MAKKQVIRLTESDLHRIIKESVNKVLNEEHFLESDNQLEEFHYLLKDYESLIRLTEKIPSHVDFSHLRYLPNNGQPFFEVGDIITDEAGGKYFDVLAFKGFINHTRSIIRNAMLRKGFSFRLEPIAGNDNVIRIESRSLRGRFDAKYNSNND